MDNWFTIEQIDRDTFSISEYKHWEETHCYLLCGEKCAILIDTGLGVSNIRKIVDSLTELPVMAVTTHVHWDHIGGHKYFDNIAVHEEEKDWLRLSCGHIMVGFAASGVCVPARISVLHRPGRHQNNMPGWL